MNQNQVHTHSEPIESAVYVWNGRMLFFRKSILSQEHAHHAIQICMGLEKPIGFRDAKRFYQESRFFIIDSDSSHTIEAGDSRHAFLFIEPELTIAQKIREKFLTQEKIRVMDFAPFQEIASVLLENYFEPKSCQEIGEVVDRILFQLAGTNNLKQTLDYRIGKAIQLISQADEKITPEWLAHNVELSESRLQHLFKEQVGVPIREYLLWRKLMQAIKSLSQFDFVTDAAHEGGFSDSAHFSRTFKRMFGITPTDILKAPRTVGRFKFFISE